MTKHTPGQKGYWVVTVYNPDAMPMAGAQAFLHEADAIAAQKTLQNKVGNAGWAFSVGCRFVATELSAGELLTKIEG
jgi:hypothetical protein